MTGNQEPPGPRRPRRLGPEELARDLANRLKSTRDPDVVGRRFLPHFDMLNAGRLILGLGALLVLAGLVAGFSWLSGLAGYETTGTVIETSPVYGCPGEPELGKVFAGESIALIGRSPDQVWLAVRDRRGPGDTVFVMASVVEVDGDASLFSNRECQPSDVLPVALDQTTSGDSSTSTGAVITSTTPTESTLTDTTATTEDSGRPGTSGTTPRNSTTTTTILPFPVAPPPSTTTSTTQPTTSTTAGSSTTSTTQPTTSSTAATTTSTTEATTTTTMEVTTTIDETTTTTMP